MLTSFSSDVSFYIMGVGYWCVPTTQRTFDYVCQGQTIKTNLTVDMPTRQLLGVLVYVQTNRTYDFSLLNLNTLTFSHPLICCTWQLEQGLILVRQMKTFAQFTTLVSILR